jgi:hypothetical protein
VMRVLNMPEGLCAEGREAIEVRTIGGHWGCDNDTAFLTRRLNRAGVLNIQLQCAQCGYAVGGPLRREHHRRCDAYPQWDEERRDSFLRAARARAAQALEDRRAAVNQKILERIAGKEEFYQSSAWRWMREQVMRRAGFKCEACTHRDAQTVHHTTYRYGLRAPLYTLRALCHVCHRRMHTLGDDWHDSELPAHYETERFP